MHYVTRSKIAGILSKQQLFKEIRRTAETRLSCEGCFVAETIDASGEKIMGEIKIPGKYLVFDQMLLLAIDYVKESFYLVDDFEIKQNAEFGLGQEKVNSLHKLSKLTYSDIEKKEYRRLFCRILSWMMTADKKQVFYVYQSTEGSKLKAKLRSWYKINLRCKIGSLQSLAPYYHQIVRGKLIIWEPFLGYEVGAERLFFECCCKILLDLLPTQDAICLAKNYPELISTSDLVRKLEEAISSRNIEHAQFFFDTLKKYEPANPALITAERDIETLSRISFLRDTQKIDVDSIDTLSGKDFENLLAGQFENLGFTVQVTPSTGDYGADLVVTTSTGTRIAIQCKRFKTKVNLKAVQEVVASLSHYSCDFGVVITNNEFLKSAENLAKKNDVELWEKNRLVSFLSGDLTFSEIKNL